MRFRLATFEDDSAINHLLRKTPLDGVFRLLYLRQPSFLASMEIQGTEHQTIIGEENGQVQALVTCSIQDLYFNGRKHMAGYIGNVRILPEARKNYTFYKGFNYFKSLQQPEEVDFYYTSLIANDTRSHALFTRGRAGIPAPVDQGGIITYLIPIKRKVRQLPTNQRYEVRAVSAETMKDVEDFLNRNGKSRNFFPSLDKIHPLLLKPENYFVAYDKSEIVGVTGVFNFKQYKQYILQEYSFPYNYLRWPVSWGMRMKGLYPMPKPGSQIQMGMLGFPVVKNFDTAIFNDLLAHCNARFSGTGIQYFTLSLHEKDPLNVAMKKVSNIRYESRLYIYNLMDSNTIFTANENNIPFIDLPRL